MKTPTQIDDDELAAAYECLLLSKSLALSAGFGDREAATVAILMRALELATPKLSPKTRASLFYQWGQ